MAYDEAVAERVRRVLGRRRGVAEKKMMGGVCFMLGGAMCCGVTGAAVMIRVGREGYAAALSEPHVRPLAFGGRSPQGFVLVDPPGYRSDAALARWIARGVAVAASLAAEGAAAVKPKAAPGGARKHPRAARPRAR
jgi:TfoX N-terminal domain